MLKLKGRTAVVTGAAGGIGRAIAVSLARRSCHLALADIDDAALAHTAAEISANHAQGDIRISRIISMSQTALRCQLFPPR